MGYGKYTQDIERINKLIEENKTGKAMREIENLHTRLDADYKNLTSFKGWFPELADIPIPWLILGIGLILFGFFTMLL